MSSPARHLRDYLVSEGTSTGATTFYGGDMPDDPDELTLLKDTPGLVPVDFLGQTEAVETLGVQAIVRATSQLAGEARAWACYDKLRRVNAVTLGGVAYTAVWAVSPPFELGPDAASVTASGSEGRRQWSVNFMAMRVR